MEKMREIARLPWHPPKVRILDWPVLSGPMQAFVVIIKDGVTYSFRTFPIVTQTFRTFDAVHLLQILIDTFGTRCAFASSECMGLDQVRELMGDISVKAFGGRLGEIAGDNFGGYRIEKIDEDRNGAIWWVCEFA